MFLAARNFDTDDFGWAQFLVIIIVAVLYGLSSLIKSRQPDQRQSAPPGPGRPRPTGYPRTTAPQRRQPPQRPNAAIGPARRTISRMTATRPGESDLNVPGGPIGPLSVPRLGAEPLEKPAEVSEEIIAAEFDQAELRRAVVYREIFDLPVSMRFDRP